MAEAHEPNHAETRSERAQAHAAWVRTVVAVGMGVVLVVLVLGAAIAWAVRGAAASAQRAGGGTQGSAGVSVGASAAVSAGMTEVPDLRGMGVDEAAMVLQTAGFAMQTTLEGTATEQALRRVSRQEPDPGSLAAPGASVAIVVPPKSTSPKASKLGSRALRGAGFVVVIDPGHQSHSDTKPELLGPGSKTTKPSVTAGSSGTTTKIPESEIVLELATNLGDKLEAAGVKVVMTRATNDVNLSNAQRAAIANSAHADLFVRIHADASTDGSMSGISTLYPAPNVWTGPTVNASKSAAQLIQRQVVLATSAVDRGAVQRSDVTGFNWAKVPSVQVEAGYPSNAVEDRLLSSPNYQDKLCDGISAGIVAYLKTKQ